MTKIITSPLLLHRAFYFWQNAMILLNASECTVVIKVEVFLAETAVVYASSFAIVAGTWTIYIRNISRQLLPLALLLQKRRERVVALHNLPRHLALVSGSGTRYLKACTHRCSVAFIPESLPLRVLGSGEFDALASMERGLVVHRNDARVSSASWDPRRWRRRCSWIEANFVGPSL